MRNSLELTAGVELQYEYANVTAVDSTTNCLTLTSRDGAGTANGLSLSVMEQSGNADHHIENRLHSDFQTLSLHQMGQHHSQCLFGSNELTVTIAQIRNQDLWTMIQSVTLHLELVFGAKTSICGSSQDQRYLRWMPETEACKDSLMIRISLQIKNWSIRETEL